MVYDDSDDDDALNKRDQGFCSLNQKNKKQKFVRCCLNYKKNIKKYCKRIMNELIYYSF